MKKKFGLFIKNKKVLTTVIGSVSVLAFVGLVAGIIALSVSALHTHVWSDGLEITKATCERAGVMEYTCTEKGCNEKYSEAIPKLSKDGKHSGGKATCYAKPTCTVCKEEYGSKLSHTGGKATCMNKAVCTLCGDEYGDINPDGHVWETLEEILPTCEETGLKNKVVCSEEGCEEISSEGEIVLETGHAWAWNATDKIDYCETCGKTASLNLEYEYSPTLAGYVVIGAGTNRDTNIIIPTKYNSRAVVGVAESAFGGYTNNINDNIVRVEFISSKMTIDGGAFSYCENLAKVVFAKDGDGKTLLANGAFEDCPVLVSVSFGTNATEIGYGAFKNCKKLSDLRLNEGLTKIDDAAFMGCQALKEIRLPQSVTKLGAEAFKGCTSLKDVILNYNITSIADGTFEGCTSLGKEFTLLDTVQSIGDRAFANCTSLERIVLGKRVKTIGAQAFEGCKVLMSVNFPNSLTTVRQDAFKDCNALKEVVATSYVQWSGIDFENAYANPFTGGAHLYIDNIKQENIVLPDEVTVIKAYAYYGYDMEELTIGKNVKSIASYAFGECTNLKKVHFLATDCNDCTANVFYKAGQEAKAKAEKEDKIFSFVLTIGAKVKRVPANLFNVEPDNLHSMDSLAATLTKVEFEEENACAIIGAKAFENSVYLKEIVVADSVKQIADRAFAGCKALEKAILPNSVDTFGKTIFANCANLKTVAIHAKGISHIEGRTKLENLTVTGGNVEKEEFASCVSLKTLTLGEGVKRIGERAFYNCTGLTNVTILDSVEVIEKYAFGNCVAMTTLAQGNALKSISDGAFSNCKELEHVAWSESLIEILFRAFYECDGLTEITLPASLKRIEKEAFYKCNKLERVDVQRSTDWFVRTNSGDLYLSSTMLSIPETAADYLTDDNWYAYCNWYCVQ